MSKLSEMMDNLSPACDEGGHPITQRQWDELRQQLATSKEELSRARLQNAIVYGTSHPEMYKTVEDELPASCAGALTVGCKSCGTDHGISTPRTAHALALIAAAQARIAGMQAENQSRQNQGYALAYDGDAFFDEATGLEQIAVDESNNELVGLSVGQVTGGRALNQ
ncbi:MAG: hypothetical protein IPL15_10470 [Comamonadaceae bacterium]|uniref:hypothetical protein n=1 Tax=Candidatus Skiveiella danica TaxID=3386177 RepID=UPI00390B189A|nr:hypothetical protein [Comamonadaceae bacterium]